MDKFMEEALKEGRKAIEKNEGGPFGAVIVKDGKIIAKGHNRVLSTNDPTCHGEIDAIRKACKKLNTYDLKGCILYTTGEPCPMCACACLWANIEKVYYGCSIFDTENIGFRDNGFYKFFEQDKRKNYFIQTEKEKCLTLYKDYKNKKDKKEY